MLFILYSPPLSAHRAIERRSIFRLFLKRSPSSWHELKLDAINTSCAYIHPWSFQRLIEGERRNRTKLVEKRRKKDKWKKMESKKCWTMKTFALCHTFWFDFTRRHSMRRGRAHCECENAGILLPESATFYLSLCRVWESIGTRRHTDQALDPGPRLKKKSLGWSFVEFGMQIILTRAAHITIKRKVNVVQEGDRRTEEEVPVDKEFKRFTLVALSSGVHQTPKSRKAIENYCINTFESNLE